MNQEALSLDCESLVGALDELNIVVRSGDGTVTHWTRGCERMYGWSAAEAVGRPLEQLLVLRDPEKVKALENDLVRSGNWHGELEHHRRDGQRVLVSVSAARVQSSDSKQAIVEFHTDVTERVHELEIANDRLAKMAVELERSNEELEQFARIASHDLSAPITSTRWLVDLLNARHCERLDTTGREIVRQISQGLDRMSELVEAVLLHARVGTTAINSGSGFPAEAAVQVAIENLRKHIQLSEAEIQAASLPVVNVEKQALCQLFQNILSNAITYRQKTVPPRIDVSATWNGRLWEFAVADNGIGIEPEWFERIFQPLQRRHGMEYAGSGIGLATCKKIVTRAGGEIWVQSTLGQGSVFRFTLPGHPPDE